MADNKKYMVLDAYASKHNNNFGINYFFCCTKTKGKNRYNLCLNIINLSDEPN